MKAPEHSKSGFVDAVDKTLEVADSIFDLVGLVLEGVWDVVATILSGLG